MIRRMDPNGAVADTELVGNAGEVGLMAFVTDDLEADWLVHHIRTWITEQGVPPSEIAVLVANKPDLYTCKLMARLERSGIPYRDETQFQDIGSEPLARLMTDMFKCVFLDHASDSYARLLELYEGRWSEQAAAASHRRLDSFLERQRSEIRSEDCPGPSIDGLRSIVSAFTSLVGRDVLVSLAPQYATGSRFDELSEQIYARLWELLQKDLSISESLARFSEEGAVRIMTVHKSKELQFHTVVALGNENQMFFGQSDANRSTFFVQISRAKDRLLLTSVSFRPRPEGYTGVWYEQRTPQQEFLEYGRFAQNS